MTTLSGEGRVKSRQSSCLSADEIRALLPHSWPFLFLDRVTDVSPGQYAVGLKNVSVAEPHFAGHFPHHSVMPGVLIIEALAQLGGILLLLSAADDNAEAGKEPPRTLLAGVSRFRFRRPVLPGDQLELRVELERAAGGVVQLRCLAKVANQAVADGALQIAL